MDFAQQLVSYYKGEWLEAALLAAFGATLAGVTLATGLYTDPCSLIEGFSYSMAFLAVSTLFAGAFQLYSNSRRLATMPAQYAQNPKAFVQAELNRFEGKGGVNSWWMPLKILWAIFVIGGISVPLVIGSELVQGVAIGLLVLGGVGFVIDGFAHRRAKQYTAALLAQNGVQS